MQTQSTAGRVEAGDVARVLAPQGPQTQSSWRSPRE